MQNALELLPVMLLSHAITKTPAYSIGQRLHLHSNAGVLLHSGERRKGCVVTRIQDESGILWSARCVAWSQSRSPIWEILPFSPFPAKTSGKLPHHTHTHTAMINDDHSLVSANSRYGVTIPVYDDGFGPLFIHRDSMGVSGIVRAKTWEDAYSICEDEFFPECDDTFEELRKEYNFSRRSAKMVKDSHGAEREAVYPADYPNGKLAENLHFVRFDTIEAPCEDEDGWTENDLFCEAYGFRPNGPNERDTLRHGIYAKDLNGDSLELLTPELANNLGITLNTISRK